jgi:MYXO-CTERM domain-containing protein
MTSLDDVQIAADDLVTIMTTAGSYSNGWWLDNLVVTPVPEPHEYAMVAGLALLGFAAFRRRRRVTP